MAITNRQDFKDYCLENKYSKWYFCIVEKALLRNWSKKSAQQYVEGHHIIPKSITPNNDIVYLTPKEHFICHLLLPKMLEGKNKRKMLFALHRLIFGNKHNNVTYTKNSNYYEQIKINCSEYFSERSHEFWNSITKEQRSIMRSGKNNSMFGKKHKQNTKQLISNKTKERLKDKNKHPLYNKGHSTETRTNMSLNSKKIKSYIFMFNNEKKEVVNLRKFCRENNLDQGAMTRVSSGKQITHKGYSLWQQ